LIQVRDTGVGISPNALPHVFSPFFRTNVGVVRGTGLGLTISREIVELHGGSIDVQSTPGQGTTLTILLPIHHDFQADGSLPSLVVGAG
jgi:signal transduction histidine kinase